MSSARESLIKISGLGVAGSVALAAHHFGGEVATGMLGGGMALLAMVAEASFGHIGLDCVHDLAHRFGGAKSARGRENRDLHRLIGETIARVLDESVAHAPVKLAADYLKDAAKAFRGEPWMNVDLSGPEVAVAEPGISSYFSGDGEAIKSTPVLEEGEHSILIRQAHIR